MDLLLGRVVQDVQPHRAPLPPPDFRRSTVLLQTRREEPSHARAPRAHLLLKGARKSFSWKDYRDLLGSDGLDRKLRRELRRIQHRPHLIDGCLTTTGITINPPTPP
ncbi:hypothetical protein OG522_37530 (plasmid) [Streptomyces sp. NBC_01431]|nr:hypothetical protein [Streptomyces sp. NBC_01431]